ncbi:RNA polymerase sigma factor [Roseofilum capinflatum]|uniref:Sigma-70 family RNA polymerase sigma factor n=1 Tax=Roseofilum capinflatum BLCC-M114 TaxID=3022440 RepID=A0ABT7BBI3_9CYAN|nr:sigma-70 family RNA polymerase sigma factor [Roseofilum capinflatum]MDJ1175969.1 sigma-70 family RNA polymerase sigma factor [Roseofilum capinflatum BLCC-M114]
MSNPPVLCYRRRKGRGVENGAIACFVLHPSVSDNACLSLYYIYCLSVTPEFMNYDLDRKLKELVRQAQALKLGAEDPKYLVKRNHILTKLIRLISQSDDLRNSLRALKQRFKEDKDLVQDSLDESYASLNQAINNYEIREESAFMAWFMRIIRNRTLDKLRRKQRDQQNNISLTDMNLYGKEISDEDKKPMSNGQKLREIIATDLEKKLQYNIAKKYPVTLQQVLLLRLEGKSAREIAIYFGVQAKNPEQTAYRWINYLDEHPQKKKDFIEYISRYLDGWEEIREDYL